MSETPHACDNLQSSFFCKTYSFEVYLEQLTQVNECLRRGQIGLLEIDYPAQFLQTLLKKLSLAVGSLETGTP